MQGQNGIKRRILPVSVPPVSHDAQMKTAYIAVGRLNTGGDGGT